MISEIILLDVNVLDRSPSSAAAGERDIPYQSPSRMVEATPPSIRKAIRSRAGLMSDLGGHKAPVPRDPGINARQAKRDVRHPPPSPAPCSTSEVPRDSG